HLDLRIEVLLVLDDDRGNAARRFVEFAFHGDAGDHVLEHERATLFRQNRHVVRVPLGKHRALFDPFAVADRKVGADNNVVRLEFLVVVVDDLDRAGLVEHDAGAVGRRYKTEAAVANDTGRANANLGRLEAAGRDTTDMEGAHRELRARLTDRLGGDDADGVANLREAVGRRIDAVALRVDAVAAGRRQRGHHLHALHAGVDDAGADFLGDEVAGCDQQLGRVERVVDIVRNAAADDALLEADDLVVTLVNGLLPDAVAGAAIVLGDDDVHRHVAQLAGQVTGVRGLERGIRQTLTGAVRRDEVLENREALTEGREDRALNDFAGGLGHQTAGAAQLADLLLVTARAGVHHDVHRV